MLCLCVTVQHEVEICRSEQPFIIQSRCAESFTSTDSHLVSPAADDQQLTHDSELPGPSGLSGRPAEDANVALSSAIDINDIVIKTAPPTKSMICLCVRTMCICCCCLGYVHCTYYCLMIV